MVITVNLYTKLALVVHVETVERVFKLIPVKLTRVRVLLVILATIVNLFKIFVPHHHVSMEEHVIQSM